MMNWKTAAFGTVLAALSSTTAMAECGTDGGRLSIVGNEFPAIQSIAAAAIECASGASDAASNLTADHQKN